MMKHITRFSLLFLMLLAIGALSADPTAQNPGYLGYQEFPIAGVDNMFATFSNPSLLGTGNLEGLGIAHFNDNERWQRHYWLFLNTDFLSYVYERDHGVNFHTLATGSEVFPAHIMPNLYMGTNYRWKGDDYGKGDFRSGFTYRPHNSTSLAFTWDNPYQEEPYYRFGMAVRPLAFVPSLADHRLEFSLDLNYSRWQGDTDYELKKPVIGISTQLLDGLKIGGTYSLEDESALLNLSLCFDKTEAGALTRLKENDNYAVAYAQFTDLSFKPFLGITPPTWLNMKLSGNVVSYRAPKYNLGPINIYDSKDKSIESLIAQIKQAKEDSSIDGILLKNPSFSTSLALQQELLKAFEDFKTSGKKISCYYDNMGNAGYVFAASIADKIYLNPMGSVDLRGMAISSPYFKNLLGSLGIEVLNFRSHKYKNAGNMFSETEMTEAEREVYNSILESMFNQMVQNLDKGRGAKLTQPAREIIEGGPYYLAQDALAKGMVDELIYEDELNTKLKKDFAFNKSTQDMEEYRCYNWSKPKENQIAVIYASGNIVMGKGIPGQKIAQASTVKLIREARKNKAYKGIILRVDSGGGSAQASDIILRELELAKTENKKPVVVSMAGVAGSGGYYISCNADRIVADPSTITGSIGVIGLAFNATEMFKKIKVNWSTVKKGEKADIGSLSRPWTKEEKDLMTRSIEAVYEDFVKKVDDGRKNMSLEEVHQNAQGRIWTGEQALKIGLVDDLGGMDVALDNMREISKLKGKLTLVDATSNLKGIKVEMDANGFNSYLPFKALNLMSEDYLKLYELWDDFAADKALMLSPIVPENIQF